MQAQTHLAYYGHQNEYQDVNRHLPCSGERFVRSYE